MDSSGSVYITDGYNSRGKQVCRLLKETLLAGQYTESIITSGQTCDAPWPIAVDANGNVYISDLLNLRILKETLSGGVYTQTTLPSGTLYGPGGIAVDGSGNVFALDFNNGLNRILKFTPSGGSYVENTIVSSSQVFYSTPAIDGNGNVFFEVSGSQILDEAIPSGTGYTVVSGGVSNANLQGLCGPNMCASIMFDAAQNLCARQHSGWANGD